VAEGQQLDALLQEIGRMREITFREVGEGTGLATDLDEYDPHYLQVFIWDHDKNQLAGAYRLGLVQKILAERGATGLYLNAFYRNTQELFNRQGDTIELGRSFITKEYQGQSSPLLVLWQGVGRAIQLHDSYRHTVGLVSLSPQEFSPFAMRFIVACLRNGRYAGKEPLSIEPLNPYKDDQKLPMPLKELSQLPMNFAQMKQVLSSLSPESANMPILLKHYCQQMNSQCHGFTVDPDFGNCVDILLTSDLAQADLTHLARYFGKEGAQEFIKRHQ
jgi:hypothetical protein